ncbi:formate dehydrogenase accessory sulfurtransferase FdhD [Nesterenkonia sp. CL21]|uniref:formate dehydrogenase accessory sulfurtransferase FdhD n=1 Tax=Nesterenkonia sp. CL21 TaxID=3064894 RepID=UPI00287A37BA|nr:formate dehydrogenase accessory sulfurtransferase FdhD [Nesterenkonia sp. CL21]MDS2172320.1 formate dehydrogenase accessory sulfurtransferase FdhD [Nesterenkonia sp. CL21]
MGRLTQRHRIMRVGRDGAVRSRGDVVAVEEPLELRLGGESFTVTMRTPGHDFELAAGFLVSEGLVAAPEEVRGMRYCAGTDPDGLQTYNVVDVTLDPRIARLSIGQHRQVLTTSACGICGTTSIDAVEKALPAAAAEGPQLSLTVEALLSLPDSLRQQQRIFDRTGGVHAAGLFDGEGELLCLREDVGRHNAVDKVVGWALTEGRLPLTGTALQVSGRASFELVQKAALAGVELLSAVGAPSSMAVDLAERAGITLAGFSRGETINIYTHPERLSDLVATPA